MFDVVHLCVERDPVRVATGLAVAGLAMAGLAAAGPAVAGLAMAGLVAAGLAEAGLVEQRVVHLHEEGDAVVVGRVKGEPDKVSGKDVGHGGSGASEPILYLHLVSTFVSLVSFPAATSVKVSVSAFGSFVLSPIVTSINASSVSFVSTT